MATPKRLLIVMRVLDLFSGLGGFSQAFLDRGHDVLRLDLESDFRPDIVADMALCPLIPYPYDVILASPPCTEFTKASMPWYSNIKPDLTLVLNTLEYIRASNPKTWVMENVRGSQPYIKSLLGQPQKRVGSRYLWGRFPIFDCPHIYGKGRLSPTLDRAALRSKIPYPLSYSLCRAIENELAESGSEA